MVLKHGEEKSLVESTKGLINAVKKSGVPGLISMGGAGSLLVEGNVKLVETKGIILHDWKTNCISSW